MKRNTLVLLGFFLICLGLTLPLSAGQLPRSGSYSGHFGWVADAHSQQLGAKRSVVAGMVSGVMFNDAGEGFMHKSRVDCALFNDVIEGRSNARGTCVVTDAAGDQIYVEWQCAGVMPACPGTERFVGGTGKYAGISGDQTFQGNFIGDTGAGWSDWKGEYTLP